MNTRSGGGSCRRRAAVLRGSARPSWRRRSTSARHDGSSARPGGEAKAFNERQGEYEIKPLAGHYAETLTAAIAAYRQRPAANGAGLGGGTQTCSLGAV